MRTGVLLAGVDPELRPDVKKLQKMAAEKGLPYILGILAIVCDWEAESGEIDDFDSWKKISGTFEKFADKTADLEEKLFGSDVPHSSY